MNPKPYHIEPTPSGASAPSDFILDSYIMHIRTSSCTHCGSASRWSETHEVLVHRTRIGLSGLRRLVPARSLAPGYPLAIVPLGTKATPACEACVDTLLTSSTRNPVERTHSETSWADTLRRKYAPAPTQSAGAPHPHATSKHIPSASDL